MTNTYEVGVTYDLETAGGPVTVVGIEYGKAEELSRMSVGRNGIVESQNGAIELKPAETILLKPIGRARLVSRNLTGRCLDIARSTQPDPDNWTWGKIATPSEAGTDYWALGLKPEQRAADGAVTQHCEAIVVAL